MIYPPLDEWQFIFIIHIQYKQVPLTDHSNMAPEPPTGLMDVLDDVVGGIIDWRV